jgi:hypothetical protein
VLQNLHGCAVRSSVNFYLHSIVNSSHFVHREENKQNKTAKNIIIDEGRIGIKKTHVSVK